SRSDAPATSASARPAPRWGRVDRFGRPGGPLPVADPARPSRFPERREGTVPAAHSRPGGPDDPMSPLVEGFSSLLDPTVLLCIAVGAVLGMLVGAFPGVTATMAVALASGFTLALDPLPGLAVLLTIYVSSNFGDRVPAILVNTPGTPASIATTFDGYAMAKQGRAGLALTASAFASAIGTFAGLLLLMVAAIPLSRLALQFGPAEMFALVVFGLTMMIGVSGGRIVKGLMAGALGLLLGTVGRDPITGDPRFTFGVLELSVGVPYIAAIIGLSGIAEVFDQILTHRADSGVTPITQFGKWFPSRSDW